MDNDLTKMTLPSGASYTYDYDGHHNVTSASSATGVQSAFVYNAKGLNTSVKAGPASKPIEANASYDAFSRLATSTNPLRKASAFGYTSRGMLAWIALPPYPRTFPACRSPFPIATPMNTTASRP